MPDPDKAVDSDTPPRDMLPPVRPIDPAEVQGFIERSVENSLKLRDQLRGKEERQRQKAELLDTRRRLRIELADIEATQRRKGAWLADVEKKLRELGVQTTE